MEQPEMRYSLAFSILIMLTYSMGVRCVYFINKLETSALSVKNQNLQCKVMIMRDLTKRCLEKLENLMDEDHIKRTDELQRNAFGFEEVDHIPTFIRYPVPEEEWPAYNFREIQEDMEKMLLSELRSVYCAAKLKDDSLYGIRANYGTAIIASLFGCPVHTFEKMLPCGMAAGGLDTLREIADKGVPDIYGGVCGKALETIAYYGDVLSVYPKMKKHVGIYMLDTQGTFDNVSIIWGSDIYLGVYDEPELLERLLRVVTDTIREVVLEHRRIDGMDPGNEPGYVRHIGGICLRNDSCINISGEMYEEMVKHYDRELLREFTGSIHFCGKAHQWWQKLLDIEGLKAINPYQGEFYDLVEIYRACEIRKVAIFNWTVPVSGEAKEMIKTGINRTIAAMDYQEAIRLLEKVHQTGWVD